MVTSCVPSTIFANCILSVGILPPVNFVACDPAAQHPPLLDEPKFGDPKFGDDPDPPFCASVGKGFPTLLLELELLLASATTVIVLLIIPIQHVYGMVPSLSGVNSIILSPDTSFLVIPNFGIVSSWLQPLRSFSVACITHLTGIPF